MGGHITHTRARAGPGAGRGPWAVGRGPWAVGLGTWYLVLGTWYLGMRFAGVGWVLWVNPILFGNWIVLVKLLLRESVTVGLITINCVRYNIDYF